MDKKVANVSDSDEQLSTEAPIDTTPTTIQPQVGQCFYVKRLDGECFPAEVLEMALTTHAIKPTIIALDSPLIAIVEVENCCFR